MKRRRFAAGAAVRLCAAVALFFCAVLASAQSTVLTATQQQWGSAWLTQGTISMVPVSPTGQPMAFGANGKFYPPLSGFSAGFQGTVVRGALTAPLLVPDRAGATAAMPLCYDQQVHNTNTNQTVDLGVRCDITGGSVSLDSYFYPVTSYAHGPAASLPAHCSLGSVYYADDTQAFYRCGVDGVFHAMAGGSPAPTVALLADTTTAGAYWTLTVGGGRLTMTSVQSGSGAVNAITFTDAAAGAYLAMSVSAGRLVVSPGSSSGAVASLQMVDTVNGTTRSLSASQGRFNLN